MNISRFDFLLFCMHTVNLRICFYPTWKLVFRNKYGPHLSHPQCNFILLRDLSAAENNKFSVPGHNKTWALK